MAEEEPQMSRYLFDISFPDDSDCHKPNCFIQKKQIIIFVREDMGDRESQMMCEEMKEDLDVPEFGEDDPNRRRKRHNYVRPSDFYFRG